MKQMKVPRGTARANRRATWSHWKYNTQAKSWTQSRYEERNAGTLVVYADSAKHAAQRCGMASVE